MEKFVLPHSLGPEDLTYEGHNTSGGYYQCLMYTGPRTIYLYIRNPTEYDRAKPSHEVRDP
jgi:hypothetical protein